MRLAWIEFAAPLTPPSPTRGEGFRPSGATASPLPLWDRCETAPLGVLVMDATHLVARTLLKVPLVVGVGVFGALRADSRRHGVRAAQRRMLKAMAAMRTWA